MKAKTLKSQKDRMRASKSQNLKVAPQTTVKTKKTLLDKIQTERQRLEKNILALSDEELVRAGVVGDWSVKDVMAHLTVWERRLLQRVKGEPEMGIELGTPAFNDQVFRENRDRSLADVRSEFRQSYASVLELVRELSEANVKKWWIAFSYNTHGHYRWANRHIRQWTKDQTQ